MPEKESGGKADVNVKTRILWWTHFGVSWRGALWRKSKKTDHISEQR